MLYAPCTVNAEFVAPYGDATYTPRLKDFAAQSVVFERHMTEDGQSGPAYASIFSGRQSDGHGVFYHPADVSSAEGPWLTEVFRNGGFYVAAWLQHMMASPELGYGRGAHEQHMAVPDSDTPELMQLLAGLRDDPSSRALVVVNHILVHSPFRLVALEPFCDAHPWECNVLRDEPERFYSFVHMYRDLDAKLQRDFPAVVAERGLSDDDVAFLARVVQVLYRSNLWQLDAHFGRLLDAVAMYGLEEESLVVFTADHGEVFYREDLLFPFTHGFQLAPEVLRVPLLIRGKSLEPRRYEAVTRSTDLLPTLASLAGIAPPKLPDQPWNGVDLAAAIRGDSPEPDLEAYSHTAVVAGAVSEASADWHHFRRYYPRTDPTLMWTQVRVGDELLQLRGVLDDDDMLDMKPVHYRLSTSGRLDIAMPERALAMQRRARLDVYLESLIAAWEEKVASGDEGLGKEREKELLKALGYVD